VRNRLKELEKVIAKAKDTVTSSGSLEKAAPKLIELVATALNCDWGTFWSVDPKAQVLRPGAIWIRRSGPDMRALEKDTRGRVLSMSEGTAGHVWRSGKAVWSTDIVKDMCLPRSLDAHTAGLSGGIWFSVMTPTRVYGIFECLGTKLPGAGADVLEELERLGRKMGKELERYLPT